MKNVSRSYPLVKAPLGLQGLLLTAIYDLLTRLVVRKKELKPRNTSNKSNRKPPKPKHQSKRRKKPRKRSERRRKPPRKHWRERQQIYSSLYRFKKWHLAWIQRRCCAYFTSRVIARKEESVNLAMIQRWRGKEKRRTCIRIGGKIKMRPRRRMIWLIGTRVGRSTNPLLHFSPYFGKTLIKYMNLEKLRQVVMSKHGNPKTTTDKVCKFFVNAVEEGKYGWFWTCPNGGDKCMYRHSLPPGFVLKTKEQRAAEKALMDKSPLKTLTLEDFLESERHKLTGTLTPVTPESFAKWKKERLDKKAAEDQAREAKEATGRAMFEKGGWEDDSEEEEESEEEGGVDDDDADWDMESMRRETERIREENEKRRLEGVGGQVAIETNGHGHGHEDEDGAVGVDEVEPETNGVNGHSEDT